MVEVYTDHEVVLSLLLPALKQQAHSHGSYIGKRDPNSISYLALVLIVLQRVLASQRSQAKPVQLHFSLHRA